MRLNKPGMFVWKVLPSTISNILWSKPHARVFNHQNFKDSWKRVLGFKASQCSLPTPEKPDPKRTCRLDRLVPSKEDILFSNLPEDGPHPSSVEDVHT